MKNFVRLLFLLLTLGISAQTPATPASDIIDALILKEHMSENSLVKNLALKNVGPSIMSGRVVDLAVNPNKPTEFFVAYASGGLWYTDNNGTSFEPLMDETPTQNLGAVAVHWESSTIWVGTGENNASRSSYAGIGLYKSTDKGNTWEFAGLPDSHHIGRIVIDSNNPNVVVVAVSGHLYSQNNERGVYRTTDGGATWSRTLYIDDKTGFIDLVAAPDNPQVLFTAAWERDRKAWTFEGNGPGSGIFKSTDGGATWKSIGGSESGFPAGSGVGRIGLAAFDSNTVYAVLDNQYRRESQDLDMTSDKLSKEDFKSMSVKDFMALDNGKLGAFLQSNRFPRQYRAADVKELVKKGAAKPSDLALYLEDANALLFDTPVVGAQVYRTDNGGKTWQKTHEGFLEDLYYSYGYYFGQVSVAPYDKDQIYIPGVPLIRSTDGGKTFASIDGDNVHSDHHALWVNPVLPGHLINGNDGGINISYDYGAHWIKNNQPSVGQFYAIAVDNQKPYKIYGGLQDNGVWRGPHNASESVRWHDSGQYPWDMIMGGDGMQVQIDPRDPNTIYTGFQFGSYFRLEGTEAKRTSIQPKHDLGEAPYRFNWQSPILISSHNPDIIYFGSNKLHRSLNKGDNWTAISPDLTQGGRQGNVAYGTLTTISESPFHFGVLYTGSDDGLIFNSRDGGSSWAKISDSFQPGLWVSRVAASKHEKGRVYATLNGYRWDDFTPYVYVSEDYGTTWKSIAAGIPDSPVNVILEDPKNENLLFVGTDNGLYVSLDRGTSWNLMQKGMPNVAIHDLVIQPEAGHLVVGTHGRSIYIADINALEKLTPNTLQSNLVVFDVEDLRASPRWGSSWGAWGRPNTPGVDIQFYAKKGGAVTARVRTSDGIVVSETDQNADQGINVLSFDVAFSKAGKAEFLKKNKKELKIADDGKTYLPAGSYTIELNLEGSTSSTSFNIK
jgi:photosystem II stability/assembly factor-like uncharacterized protein